MRSVNGLKDRQVDYICFFACYRSLLFKDMISSESNGYCVFRGRPTFRCLDELDTLARGGLVVLYGCLGLWLHVYLLTLLLRMRWDVI